MLLGVEPFSAPASRTEPPEEISDTERAIYGSVTLPELRAFLAAWAKSRMGSTIAEIRFRAGRIDAVWDVELQDGRAVVIKTHRTPVHLDATRAAIDAQRTLAAAGFPCPLPLAGPDEIEGRVLTAETLVVGTMPDRRDPAIRRLLAEGLSRHIKILRDQPDLIQRAGPGPSWCHYQGGPWPVPHDTIVDFRSTLDGFEWLDAFGQRAADQILANREAEKVVVGHADWYAGNTAVVDGVLVGTFDWELIADTEAVIAGFAASCYAASPTGGGGLSTPQEVVAFLRDYEDVRAEPLSEREQRAPAAAAAWILSFNARWQAALIAHDHCDYATIALVQDHKEEYLSSSWQ
jgi:Ser/Thr protein kinase RdoA (MazF antagonist)